ncbi:arginine exporter [Escherichia coli]|nr:arginine exporter [Escherichia coli]
MFSYYFQGLALGAAMILPLGPQNAFVMNQGIRRQYHIMIALLCAISDLVLICAGIFGGSALLMQSPWLLALVTWGGVAFLLWYGFGAFKTAMSSNIELASAEVLKQGRWKIIANHAGSDLAESACFTWILLLYWAALAGNLMWNQNVGLRSGQLAPLSCGSLVWLFSQPGWHRACARQNHSALSIW